MVGFTTTLAATAATFSVATAYDIPANLQKIYDAHKVRIPLPCQPLPTH